MVGVVDRDKMHYTEAVMNEVWRLGNVLILPLPRQFSAPVKVAGFNIPKDAVYMTNIYSVHMDQQYWKDPEVFRDCNFDCHLKNPTPHLLKSKGMKVKVHDDNFKNIPNRPERFIVDGNFKSDERNIPFGIGKRRCIGESLARMENFLIFANMIKHFTFSQAPGSTLPDNRPDAGLTNGPQAFNMKVETNT